MILIYLYLRDKCCRRAAAIFINELSITLIIRRRVGSASLGSGAFSERGSLLRSIIKMFRSRYTPLARASDLYTAEGKPAWRDPVYRAYIYTPHVNGFNNIAASEIDSCKRAHIATLRGRECVKSLRWAYRYERCSLGAPRTLLSPLLCARPRLFHYHNFL